MISGAFGFGEPPRVIMCRGDKGHDDGNKRNKGDVDDHWKTDVKLRIGTGPVNLRFPFFPTIVAICKETPLPSFAEGKSPQTYQF